MESNLAKQCCPHQLLHLVTTNDSKAMQTLTKCYGQRLLEIGRRRCRTEEQAHDARQDALLAATTHLNDFRGEGSIESWLSTMVVNACRHMQRGRKSDTSIHVEISTEMLSKEFLPSEKVMHARLGTSIYNALQTLSPTNQAIVLLAEVNDWKSTEIAKSLSLNEQQVRKRLSRSRQKLQELLQETWLQWFPEL